MSRSSRGRTLAKPGTATRTAPTVDESRPSPWFGVREQRVLGLVLLFAVVLWWLFLQAPVLEPGYLDAGDDHVHVAFANELTRIWQGEHRALGWSRLYATGAPIFLLRPPGFYVVVSLCHVV